MGTKTKEHLHHGLADLTVCCQKRSKREMSLTQKCLFFVKVIYTHTDQCHNASKATYSDCSIELVGCKKIVSHRLMELIPSDLFVKYHN